MAFGPRSPAGGLRVERSLRRAAGGPGPVYRSSAKPSHRPAARPRLWLSADIPEQRLALRAPRAPCAFHVALSQVSRHKTLGGSDASACDCREERLSRASECSVSLFAKQKGRGKKRQKISVWLVCLGFVKKHKSLASLIQTLFFPKGLCPAPLHSFK